MAVRVQEGTEDVANLGVIHALFFAVAGCPDYCQLPLPHAPG